MRRRTYLGALAGLGTLAGCLSDDDADDGDDRRRDRSDDVDDADDDGTDRDDTDDADDSFLDIGADDTEELEGDDADEPEPPADDTDAIEPPADDADTDPIRSPAEIALDWASAADNVEDEGDIVDATGVGEVEIANGDVGDTGNYVFEPAIVRIDRGTVVTWEWVTSGHDVTAVASEGATLTDWDDHPETKGEGHTHTATFPDSGVALYECAPHRAQNQRGAIIVE